MSDVEITTRKIPAIVMDESSSGRRRGAWLHAVGGAVIGLGVGLLLSVLTDTSQAGTGFPYLGSFVVIAAGVGFLAGWAKGPGADPRVDVVEVELRTPPRRRSDSTVLVTTSKR